MRNWRTTISIHKARHSPKPRGLGSRCVWGVDTSSSTPCTAITGKHDRSAALHICKDKTTLPEAEHSYSSIYALPQLTVFEVLYELLLGFIYNHHFQLHFLLCLWRNYASLKPQRCLGLLFSVLQTFYESLQQTRSTALMKQ